MHPITDYLLYILKIKKDRNSKSHVNVSPFDIKWVLLISTLHAYSKITAIHLKWLCYYNQLINIGGALDNSYSSLDWKTSKIAY